MRQSIKFANWTKTREEWYKKECDEILYSTNSEIMVEDAKVFIATGNKKTYLLTVNNPKSTWFQIWLKVRDER